MASRDDVERTLKAELHLFAKGDLRRELERLRCELAQELTKEGSLSVGMRQLDHADLVPEKPERSATASLGLPGSTSLTSYSNVVSFESETEDSRTPPSQSHKVKKAPASLRNASADRVCVSNLASPVGLTKKGFSGSLATESVSADMFNVACLEGMAEEELQDRIQKPSPPAAPLPCQAQSPRPPSKERSPMPCQESRRSGTHSPPTYPCPSEGLPPAVEPEVDTLLGGLEWSSHHLKGFLSEQQEQLETPMLFRATPTLETVHVTTQGTGRFSGASLESEGGAHVVEHFISASEKSKSLDPTSFTKTKTTKTQFTVATHQSSYTEEELDLLSALPDLVGHQWSQKGPMSNKVKTHCDLERAEQGCHKAWANTSMMKSMRKSAADLTAGKFRLSLIGFGGMGKRRQNSLVMFTQQKVAALDREGSRGLPSIALRFVLENILQYLDAFSVLIISVNALTIGIQTDHMARHGEASGFDWRWVETVFCVLFLAELLLRMSIFRSYYFRMPSWRWNVFDCIVVGLQVLEELVLLAGPSGIFVSVSMLRTVRILRLMRLIRVIRLLRFFSELRTIVCAVTASLKPLCSTILLFFILIYLVGVFLTQLVVQAKASQEYSPEQTQGLNAFFGSVPTTILMLWQSISGGLDWGDAVVPLARISPIMAILFSLYIAFSVLAMMNIVTGVFVESAISKGREDQDSFLINAVRDLFRKVYQDENGQISWEDFQRHLEEKVMQDYFAAIDVDTSEARGLFTLLDWNDDGLIEAEEFLSGCVRLKGSAKALDLQLLMRESRRSAQKIFSRVNDAIAMLRRLSDCMDLPPLPDLPMGKQPTGHTTVVNGV